jgi:hypothetical protein
MDQLHDDPFVCIDRDLDCTSLLELTLLVHVHVTRGNKLSESIAEYIFLVDDEGLPSKVELNFS